MPTTIYLVVTSSGSYDDYGETIYKAYFDKDKAKECMDKYNIELKLKKEKAYKCMSCEALYIDWDEVEDRDLFIQELKEECPNVNLENNDNSYSRCKHEVDMFVIEEHDAKIQEIEVE